MRDCLEVWAEDLDALARVVSVISQPEIAKEYQAEKGGCPMADLGLSVDTLVSLYAAKFRAEARATSEYQSRQKGFEVVPHE